MRRQPTDAEMQQILANLKLPHMPSPTPVRSASAAGATTTTAAPSSFQKDDHEDPAPSSSPPSKYPSLRILVVADIDLASASALAEYTLQQKNQVFDARDIDLCIACGSFCRDEDLGPYWRGTQQRRARQERRQKRRQQQEQQQQQHDPEQSTTTTTTATTRRNKNHNFNSSSSSSRNSNNSRRDREAHASNDTATNGHEELFWRSREETSALEGLMTAALSQLESIVCRVVYCPGASDPLTTLLHHHYHRGGSGSAASDDHPSAFGGRAPRPKRLTPNSRNLHQQWLPLAPGIGCAALLYLDNQQIPTITTTTDQQHAGQSSSSSLHHHHHHPPPIHDSGSSNSPRRGTMPPRRSSSSSGNARSPSLDHDGPGGQASPQDEGSDHEDIHDANDIKLLTEQLLKLTNSDGYCSTLERLLQLAPAAPRHQQPIPFAAARAAARQQTILVTHYVDCRAARHGASVDEDDDDDDDDLPVNGYPAWTVEPPDRPWPVEHSTFVSSQSVQQLLCLEIASGSGARGQENHGVKNDDDDDDGGHEDDDDDHDDVAGGVKEAKNANSKKSTPSSYYYPPEWIKCGKSHILLPGSLRQRGDFSIVEVALQPDEPAGRHVTTAADQRKSSSAPPKPLQFAWRVQNVDFYQVNRFPRPF